MQPSLPLSHVFIRDVRLHPANVFHRFLILLFLWIHQDHQFLKEDGEKEREKKKLSKRENFRDIMKKNMMNVNCININIRKL